MALQHTKTEKQDYAKSNLTRKHLQAEYYQEIPQSHTADQHIAARGRDSEHRQSQHCKSKATIRNVLSNIATAVYSEEGLK